MPERPRDLYGSFGGVPTVEPETRQPYDYLDVRANPDSFSKVGRAVQGLGQTGQEVGDKIGSLALEFQQRQNATDALNATTGASKELGDAETQYRSLAGNNAVTGYAAFQKQVQDIGTKYQASLNNPMARLAFQRDFASLSNRSLMNGGLHLGDQQKQAHFQALEGGIKEESSALVRNTQTGEAPDFSRLTARVDMLAGEQGLGPDARNALLQKTTGQVMHDMVVARVATGDTPGAARVLADAMSAKAPGTDLPLLDADHQAQLSQFIQQKQTLDANRSLTEQMRSLSLQDKLRRDAGEKAGNGYVTQMLKDPTQVDAGKIADDPNLSYEQKLSLTSALNNTLAGKNQGHDIGTYGPGFVSAYQAVHLPEGDPNRITDPFTLYGRVGKDLTVAGVDKLTGEIQDRRTPQGEAEAEMKKAFLSNARNQISGTNEGLHLKDPKGDELYLKFLATALPAFDAGRASGKSAAELLNPDSKDYIGKSIATFKRPLSQWTSDLMNDNAPAAPGEAGKGPDLTSQGGIISAYHDGKISRQDAAAALVKGGFAAPAQPVPRAPGP
jgi:hypothetical protein